MTLEELKTERPDLVELFESMDREQLLEQIYKECLDGINMEERCQVFMNECTNMSYTTYAPEVIKGLISNKQENDLDEWCKDLIEDYSDKEILKEIKKRAKKMSKKNYNHCEGCGLEFHNDLLVMNDDLELTCEECVEEGKVDKRVSNLLTAACVFIAFTGFVLIFHHCSK